MILHLVRILFVIVIGALTFFFFALDPDVQKGGQSVTWYILIPMLLAGTLVLVDMFWRDKHLQTLGGVFFGILAGLVIAFMLSLMVDLMAGIFPGPDKVDPPGPEPQKTAYKLPGNADKIDTQKFTTDTKAHLQAQTRHNEYAAHLRTIQLVKFIVGAAAVFLCVSFVLQTKDVFRFVIPYVEFSKQTKGPRPYLLDTSVIIDGRIADIAETRILESEMIVPRFILAELQAIADSDDKLKRNRGRRGLDVLNRLQGDDKTDIRILDVAIPTVEEQKDVDAKLVALGEHLNGRVVTNDYNLNKIAQLRGVDVVNINDLANALKPIVLPGETLDVKIIKPGEEAGQGVGYLDDGTMIVAEQSRDFVGKTVTITVTSVLQTSAGRMIFGRTDADKTFTRRDRRT